MESTHPSPSDRRAFLTAATGVAFAARAAAQAPAQAPVSPVATPRDWTNQTPVAYPDPDLVALDPRFRRYVVFNNVIKRLHIGTGWAEGPAWNGVGKYLVWSDIPANAQMRWIEDDDRVTTFATRQGSATATPSTTRGGSCSCEHGNRRVARYEPNGTVTVIAERFQGKRLNSPNDAVVHPDGSIWFTDPSYGIGGNYEGFKAESETKEAVYRADPKTGTVEKVTDGRSAQRAVLLARLQEALCRRYRHVARHQGVRRGRQGAAQR